MNILVTGASGFIGAARVSRLDNKGHHVVPPRRAATAGNEAGPTWNPQAGQIHLEPAGQLDAVVHLAGENIAQRWTPTAKARMRASRVDATRLLCEALARQPQPPRVLVCASATGLSSFFSRNWTKRSTICSLARPERRLRPSLVS
ncbi:MAG: NAD-dependent epimerase/dehydratase family protein [Verrucomicrobia bacterium]|nr:NAD-dependent epimerase/dehydratase family protein [Verrucomicrobiota bacterium]